MSNFEFKYFEGKEWELIDLFYNKKPDFVKAKEIIESGADINKNIGGDSVLSEIISGYSVYEDGGYGDDLEEEEFYKQNYLKSHNESGKYLIQTIEFFLENGFDVNLHNGKQGADCLHCLTVSIYDTGIIDAAKVLLDAGAKNISVEDDDDDCTAESFVCMEADNQYLSYQNFHLANIFHAMSKIYEAWNIGESYQDIQSYESAIGKWIYAVYLLKREGDESETRRNITKEDTLYFWLNSGEILCCENGIWLHVDSKSKMDALDVIDVSRQFDDVLDMKIQNITFDFEIEENGRVTNILPKTVITTRNERSLILDFKNKSDDIIKIKKAETNPKGAQYIEILDGGMRGSSYMAFMPTKVDATKKIDYFNMDWKNQIYSVEESNIENFVWCFLRNDFDNDLIANKMRGDGSDFVDGFDWYGINFYTYDSMKKILEKIEEYAKLIENDFSNPKLDDLKSWFSPFYMVENDTTDHIALAKLLSNKESSEFKNLHAQLIEKYKFVVLDFYKRFIECMNELMENHQDCNLIAIVGP